MTEHNDILSALEAELDVELIEWDPTTQGERVVGTVKTVEYVAGKNGVLGIVTLTTPSGALARVACGAKNLKSQLESAKVQPGDGLALQYEGQRQPRNGGGNPYNAYRVAHAPVGDRRPADVFKVPEQVDSDDDLIPGAADDPFKRNGSDTTEAPGF